MNKITIIGSINVDEVLLVDHIVKPGETIISHSFNKYGGGKGANQAIACARLGSKVSMIGAIGNDDNGIFMKNNLLKDKIDISGVSTLNTNTGRAIITVDKMGENSIILISGANHLITKQDIDRNIDVIKDSDYIILQNELPIDITNYCIQLANKLNIDVVFNNAPAIKIDDMIYDKIDFLVVNENEFEISTNNTGDINYLFNKNIKNVLLTLGKKGARFISKDFDISVDAIKVNAIDTTGAGDSFIGAFFSRLNKNISFDNVINSLKFATKVASLTVQKKGAQSSIPYLADIKSENND